MATTITPSLVQQYASMTPAEFGENVEPKWNVGERLNDDVLRRCAEECRRYAESCRAMTGAGTHA